MEWRPIGLESWVVKVLTPHGFREISHRLGCACLSALRGSRVGVEMGSAEELVLAGVGCPTATEAVVVVVVVLRSVDVSGMETGAAKARGAARRRSWWKRILGGCEKWFGLV